jgi:hypothetical protein
MTTRERAALRAAAALEVALAATFGAASAWAIGHFRKHRELPMTPFGFRALSGPFEALGNRAFELLGAALVAVCGVDLIAGMLVWQRRRVGVGLGLVVAVPQFMLALGFALPFLIVGIPIRIALALAGRRALS